jgi:trehalose 6-phosphate phosphatase
MQQIEIPTDLPLFIGLDRDGTLVPYTDKPEEAVMPPFASWVLRQLADLPDVHVAIISARGTNHLRRDVGASKVILAGNYGLEVRYPGAAASVHPMALRAVPELQSIKEKLSQLVNEIPSLSLEDHGYSLNISYLSIPEDKREGTHNKIRSLTFDPTVVTMRPQPSNYEFVPNVQWDKSMALTKIESALSLKPSMYFPIFMGDTAADEPALAWANIRGGLSILVAKGNITSNARLVLGNPEEAASFLDSVRQKRATTVKH